MGGLGGCCYAVCAIVTVLFNLIIFILGLVFTGLGGVLKWGTDLLKSFAVPMIDGVVKGIVKEGGNNTISVDGNALIQNVFDILTPLAVVLIVTGVVFLVVGFCGLFGPCCQSKCLLVTYVIITALIVIFLVVGVILITTKKDQFVENTKASLVTRVQKNFEGAPSTNLDTLIFLALHQLLHCCGINNGSDFEGAQKWNRDLISDSLESKFSQYINLSEYSGNTSFALKYPVSCCNFNYAGNCTLNPTTDNSYIHIGCFGKIQEQISPFWPFVVYGVGGLTGLEGLLLLLGALMLYHVFARSSKVSPQ